MRRITIVGGGQSGLQLGLGLLKKGCEVTVVSNRTGDDIYNGAVDNATGVAGILELARVFAEGDRPDRSLMFVAWTAEEAGLLGAYHYAANPLRPLETTVANLNLDSLLPGTEVTPEVVVVSSRVIFRDQGADAAGELDDDNCSQQVLRRQSDGSWRIVSELVNDAGTEITSGAERCGSGDRPDAGARDR